MTETLELFSSVQHTLVANRVVPSVEPKGASAACGSEFQGKTFDPLKDQLRLKGQLKRVKESMSDSRWRTLSEISAKADVPLSTVGSRVRDLRKPKFGLWTVDHRRLPNGLWEYRLGERGL